MPSWLLPTRCCSALGLSQGNPWWAGLMVLFVVASGFLGGFVLASWYKRLRTRVAAFLTGFFQVRRDQYLLRGHANRASDACSWRPCGWRSA